MYMCSHEKLHSFLHYVAAYWRLNLQHGEREDLISKRCHTMIHFEKQ